MIEHETNVRLRTSADRRRWQQLRADPVAMVFAEGGAKVAHTVFLPGLNAGHYGFTEREIRARLDQHIAAALTPAEGEAWWSEDEQFMWRLGFEAVALSAIERVMAQARAAAATIIGAATGVLPFTRRAGGRRLRLEDFGSLPTGRL